MLTLCRGQKCLTRSARHVLSTLDLRKGYWQIPLKESSKEKTAFTTPFGLYEFNVLAFGLHSAPATFQQLINHVLLGCKQFAGAYIDDIIVFSASWSEHIKHLCEVFSRLEKAGLALNVVLWQGGDLLPWPPAWKRTNSSKPGQDIGCPGLSPSLS